MVQAEFLAVGRKRLARGRPSFRANRTPLGWIAGFCLPALTLYGLLIVVPLVTAFYYGLYQWEGTRRAGFAGLGNYQEVLTRYPLGAEIPAALWHNVLFFIGTMAIQNTIGLGLAVMLYRNPRFKRFFQAVFSLPYLISPLIVGYIWSLLLSPSFGPVNYLLESIGLESLARPWLGEPSTALPILILVNAWQWIGGPMLIFLAALGGIPKELEEAASLDGASASRAFWSVRFPLLTPAIGVITVLTFIGCFNIFDLVYALGGSDGGPGGAMDDILRQPVGLPTSLDLDNYKRAWETASLSTYFANSLVITTASVALCVAVSATAAYALSRWQFRGRALLAAFFISGIMIPAKLGLLPVFYMYQSFGLIDSRLGLVLLYAASGVPFSIFVIMGFVRGLPGELEESARLDGANEGRMFVSIALPLMRPALAVVTVFQFAPTWNDFFYPLVLMRSDAKYTVPVGLTRFFGEYAADRATLFAGLVIALVPLAIVFALATRHIVSGLTAGMSR